MSNLRPTARVARGATYLFLQGFATAFIGLVYFAFLAHTFGSPAEQWQMGAYALLSFILSLSSVLGTLALQYSSVKYIAQYQAQGEMEKAKGVAARVLQIGLLTSVGAFSALFFPAEWLSTLLFNTPDHALLIRVVAVCSIFAILQTSASGILQGLQRMREVAFLGLTISLTHTFVGIGLLLAGWRLYAVVIGWLAGWVITAACSLFLSYRYLGFRGKPHPVRPLLSFSFPLYISTNLGFFIAWADQLLLVSYMSLLHGTIEAQSILGIYYVAIRASVVPSIFSNAVVTALFPSLSGLYAQQGLGSLKDAFRMSTRYAVLLGFPLVTGVATLAFPVIILFGGWSYIGAAEPLIIISLGVLIGTLGLAIGPILMTLERTSVVSMLSVIGVALNLSLSYATVVLLSLGMIGAAWARTLAAIIGLLVTLYAVTRYVKIAFDREAIWKSLVASALLTLAIIGVDLVRMLLSPSDYQFLVIRLHLLPIYVLAGAAAYAIGLVLLKAIKQHDVEIFEDYLPGKLKWVATWASRFASAK